MQTEPELKLHTQVKTDVKTALSGGDWKSDTEGKAEMLLFGELISQLKTAIPGKRATC